MPGFTINRVCLSGNLTRDPEHRSTSGGTSLVKLRIASNERYKDSTTGEWQDRPGYYDVTLWKGMADWVASNIKKGDAVVVEGRLRWREWEADDGSKRQAVDITADSIVPVTRDGSGGGGSSRSYSDSDADVPVDTGDLPQPGAGSLGPARRRRRYSVLMPYKQRYDAPRQAQVKAVNARKKHANQDRMWEYLTTHSCVDCGEADPLVLEFDHREPIGKYAGRVMSQINTGLAWRTILAEIAKCDLVCANCHARRSAFRRRSWRWLRRHVVAGVGRARQRTQPPTHRSQPCSCSSSPSC